MNRRGSALLIVLGMVSFLVVSAVAFSAYMRSARLPSSYLLRTSSSRNLVKAGLAEAMDEIDRAIGNNPHPGVGTDSGYDPKDPTQLLPNRNQWRNRVFVGTNTLAKVDETVSTLTLEGLAYVPAPLVNEARYYSRRAPAGRWHSLGFDSGRFAFCAIDVSDYFDVNRVMASPQGGGRTSADNARVSLGYLFENAAHTGWRANPAQWDTFMDAYADDGSGGTVPLVSWADLNLAIWDRKPAGVVSPWCRFIDNGTEFVRDDPEERLMLSNMVFVTDSWYPPRAGTAATKELNIAAKEKQPFHGLRIDNASDGRNRGVDELAQNNNDFMRRFADNVSLPELVQLCDYLDVDSVPTTLVMPTTERVPMLTGVSLAGSEIVFQVETVPRPKEQKDKDGNVVARYEVTYYKVTLRGELRPMVSAVYPFKHARGSEDSDSFQAQVFATVTLVPKGSESSLRRKAATSPVLCAWENGSRNPEMQGYGGDSAIKPVAVMRSAMKPLSVKRSPANDRDCLVGPVDPTFGSFTLKMTSTIDTSPEITSIGEGEDDSDRDCTLRVVQKVNPTTGAKIGSPVVTKGFVPSNADLSGLFAARPQDVADSATFVPVVQLCVRIVNSNGDVVDLMPACADDDKRPSTLVKGDNLRSAFERPFLRFWDKSSGVDFKLTEASLKDLGGKAMAVYPQAYVADDPRFNHAPEDLVAVESLTSEIQQYWLDNNTSGGSTGNVPKDGDIYLATSDAGYLQSKYEFAHILNITGLEGNDMWGVLNSGNYNGNARTSFGDLPGAAAMWRSYRPYKVGASARDNFDLLEMTAGTGGTRVCPYTPDTTVMMGALANTPIDWWAAATNDAGSVKQQMLSNYDNALKYTYSQRSQETSTKVNYEDLEYLAQDLISEFHRSKTVDGWRTIWDELGWGGTDSLFRDIEEGNPGVTFSSADRKFLYGFWRDCFEARQQLFLIFVRAEPMMMGGGFGGKMPPMLGARAVALVWRDPTATQNNAPHRMRVLFYRQFD